MAVSLKKSAVREYTPVHLTDEEITTTNRLSSVLVEATDASDEPAEVDNDKRIIAKQAERIWNLKRILNAMTTVMLGLAVALFMTLRVAFPNLSTLFGIVTIVFEILMMTSVIHYIMAGLSGEV